MHKKPTHMTRTASSRRTAWNSAPNRFPRTDFTLARLAIWMLGAMLTLGSHAQEPPAAAPQADPHAGHDHAHHGHAHHNHGPRQPAVDLPPVKSVDPITIPLDVHNKVRRITVQHGGRYKPLDTLAREFATKITGSETVAGQTHLDFLLQCTVQQVEMSRHPLFSISNEKFREQLELSASPSTDNHYSYYELVNHAPFMDHLKRIAKAPKGKKMDDLDKKIKDLESRLVDFRSALLGQYIRLIPHPTDPKAPWQTVDWLIETSDQRYANLKAAWMGFGGAFKASENAALRQAADTLVTQLQALPAKFRPSKAKIEEELHYNEFTPYNKAWKLMMLGVVIALVALFVKKPWCDVVTAVVMFASFALLTYGIKLRWDIANRFPASNMFESLLFLSWGAALFTVIGPILLRNRIVTLTGAAIAGISLMLADVLPVSAYIKPVSPVLLNTFWMALHVPVIMVSYSILAIAVLVAHVQIIGEGIFGKRWKHVEATDTMLYWYVISGSLLLLVGILTGSLWAASSWGRYWGWDPKEVWSLVAFLGYMAILHTRTSREKVSMPMKLASMALITAVFIVCIRTLDLGNDSKSLMVAGGTFAGTAVAMVYFMLANSSFATAAKNIIAFWLIIMTYVGVNYVLGTGLHSYGFGVGNVASKTMLVGGIDLIILGICSLFFYYRNSVAKTDN